MLVNTALKDNPKTEKGSYQWVKNVNRGQVVSIIEEKSDGTWFMVRLPDKETVGWVEAKYIHIGKKSIIAFIEKTKLYDQPDANSLTKRTLPPGSKAIVLKKMGDWVKVSSSWRMDGWVKKGTFEKDTSIKSQAVYEVYIGSIGMCAVEASSTLLGATEDAFSVKNLFDKNLSTSWQEGDVDSGVGEWIEISFPENISIALSLVNGIIHKDPTLEKYGAEGDLYLLNNRVKSVRIDHWDANGIQHTSEIQFYDEHRYYQDAGMYDNIDKLKITIDSVFRGMKWNDTSIGELKIIRSQ